MALGNRSYDVIEWSWWEAQEEEAQNSAADIVLYRRYYDGDFDEFHRAVSARQLQYIFQWKRLGLNLCRRAVKSPVSRLRLTNLAGEGREAEQVWKWLDLARIDARQRELYLNAARDGAGYLLAWYPQPEEYTLGGARPRLTIHPAYNGEAGIYPVRSLETGEVERFQHYFKRYDRNGDKGEVVPHRNDYYPDRVEKFRASRSGGDWEQLSAEPWVDRFGQPLGLPVIEFAYPDGSKLKDLLGIQDLLNKCLMDFMEWADKAIYPTKYILGASRAYDADTGAEVRFETGPDVVWASDNPADANATVGQLLPPGSEGILAIRDSFKHDFIEVGNLSPLDFLPLGASPWSGEALKTIELSFLAEVEDVQAYWGNDWEDLARLMLRMENTFGRGGYNPEVMLEAQWQDPAVRDSAFWEELATKKERLGWSFQEVQREAGLTEEQIDRMGQEREEAAPPMVAGGSEGMIDET